MALLLETKHDGRPTRIFSVQMLRNFLLLVLINHSKSCFDSTPHPAFKMHGEYFVTYPGYCYPLPTSGMQKQWPSLIDWVAT